MIYFHKKFASFHGIERDVEIWLAFRLALHKPYHTEILLHRHVLILQRFNF